MADDDAGDGDGDGAGDADADDVAEDDTTPDTVAAGGVAEPPAHAASANEAVNPVTMMRTQ